MIRKASAVLAATVAAVLLSSAPAYAAVSNQPGGSSPGYLASATRSLVAPCVTTTWRAEHWRTDKTRLGALCYKVDRSTWIPKAWPRVGYVFVRGELRPVFLRTV